MAIIAIILAMWSKLYQQQSIGRLMALASTASHDETRLVIAVVAVAAAAANMQVDEPMDFAQKNYMSLQVSPHCCCCCCSSIEAFLMSRLNYRRFWWGRAGVCVCHFRLSR